MTRIEELEKARNHLQTSREALSDALKCAVLSRARRAKVQHLESETLQMIGEIDDELDTRRERGE